jgi:hypothetical protein
MNDNPYVSPERPQSRSHVPWKRVLWVALIAALVCGTAASYLTSVIDAHYPSNLQLDPSTGVLLLKLRSALVLGVYLAVVAAIIAAVGRWRVSRDQRRADS